LQDELDEANHKIRMLEHGDSTLLISAADNAKDIHRVLKESLLGSKFAKLAGLMLGGERTTAAKPRFKRGKLKRAPPGEEHWDNPVQAEPNPKKRATPPWAKTGKLADRAAMLVAAIEAAGWKGLHKYHDIKPLDLELPEASDRSIDALAWSSQATQGD